MLPWEIQPGDEKDYMKSNNQQKCKEEYGKIKLQV